MNVEHRANPSIPVVPLRIHEKPSSFALVAFEEPQQDPNNKCPPSARDRVLEALSAVENPLRTTELRKLCRMRTSTLCSLLSDLSEESVVTKTAFGWKLMRPVKITESTDAENQISFPLSSSP